MASWALLLTAVLVAAGWLAMMAGPRLVGWQSTIVLSGSMEPTLRVGDIAFIEQLSDPHQVQAGDIITFRSPGEPSKHISHRVVAVVNDGNSLRFQTKGDSNEQPDQSLIPVQDLVGKVRYRLPYLGYIGDWLRGPDGFLLFVGIPGMLLIISELRNIARELAQARHVRLDAKAGGGRDE